MRPPHKKCSASTNTNAFVSKLTHNRSWLVCEDSVLAPIVLRKMLEFFYIIYLFIILRINAWLLYCVITQIPINACSKIRYIYYLIQMIVSCLQMESQGEFYNYKWWIWSKRRTNRSTKAKVPHYPKPSNLLSWCQWKCHLLQKNFIRLQTIHPQWI